MPSVKRFEDLLMWQRARSLANLTYKLTEQTSFRDSDLRSQMRRASVSVMSNIAEGFGRGANEELLYFLYVGKGSVAELQSQLYLSVDLRYISKDQFHETFKLADETARLIQSFARSMRTAGRASFRHKRVAVPWRERVEQVMKELGAESTEEEPQEG